jgi:hypothetical protein
MAYSKNSYFITNQNVTEIQGSHSEQDCEVGTGMGLIREVGKKKKKKKKKKLRRLNKITNSLQQS